MGDLHSTETTVRVESNMVINSYEKPFFPNHSKKPQWKEVVYEQEPQLS